MDTIYNYYFLEQAYSFSLYPSLVKQLSKNSFKDLVALLTEVLPDGWSGIVGYV